MVMLARMYPASLFLLSFRVISYSHDGSFDQYPEDNATAGYGALTEDLFGEAFPSFEYTGILTS